MGVIQKEGNVCHYERKSTDIKRSFCICELLLQRQRRKVFLLCTVTANEKWIYYDNLKHGKSWCKPDQSSTSTAKSIIWKWYVVFVGIWRGSSIRSYIAQPLLYMITNNFCNWTIKLKKKMIFSTMHSVPCLKNAKRNARYAWMRHAKFPYPPYSPDLAPLNYHLFQFIHDQLLDNTFLKISKLARFMDSLKRCFFTKESFW